MIILKELIYAHFAQFLFNGDRSCSTLKVVGALKVVGVAMCYTVTWNRVTEFNTQTW
jgi:hypothetical protein